MAFLRMSGRPKKASTARTLAVLLATASGLCGCSWSDANPVEWYRHLSGVDKNDVADKGQRNELNLEAGGQEPYPNLGTVPPPPERAMSSVDLEKLQQGLAADRKNAEYSDQEVRQGHQVPPLPGTAPAAEAVLAQNGAAAPGQAPSPAAPAASSQPAAAPGQAAAPSQAAPAGQAAAPVHGTPTKGSAAPPQESSLAPPSVRSVPQGEMPSAAPPPTGVQPARQQAALPAAAASSARPPAPASAAAAPLLTAPPPEPAVEPAVMRAPHRHGTAVTLEAAQIGFAGGGKTLGAQDSQRLAEVARLQKEGGGSLRVIAYSGGSGAASAEAQLDSFGEALDRANVIAQALTRLGVPAGRITVQAAPEQLGGGVAAGQAVILLDY